MGLTEESFLRGDKDVTRRLGWRFAKEGDLYLVVNRVMGISEERPVRKLGIIEVVNARFEPLNWITRADVRREGFAGWTPRQFVEFFCKHMKCPADKEITRIEFRVQRFLAGGKHGRR